METIDQINANSPLREFIESLQSEEEFAILEARRKSNE
jgi:hypothetical protein